MQTPVPTSRPPATTLQPILHSFAYALDYLGEQLTDVAPAALVAQPSGMANHPAWQIGHLTFTCQMLAGVLGVPEWLPEDFATRYGAGSAPTADVTRYEPKDEALAMLRDAQYRITEFVERADESQLISPFPDPAYRDVFPTVRHALTQVLVGHTAYHVGQVAAWRRAMGLPPLARAFE